MSRIYPCDLHGHTNRSDGNDTPLEFILHAVDRGLKVAAITDHDVVPPATLEVDGKEEDIVAFAASKGLRLLLGIEISCETYVQDVHLVCFGCDWTDPYFAQLEREVAASKIAGYRALVDALRAEGKEVSWEEVLENGGHPVPQEAVQKKMIFELLARKGYFGTWQEAKLYVKNKEALSIPREKPDALSVIRKVRELGGIVIMAHPYLVSEPVPYQGKEISRKAFMEELVKAGLQGVEASYTYDKTSYGGTLTKEEIEKEVRAFAADHGLFVSGGSDYHNDGKKGVKNPRDLGDAGLTWEEFISIPALAAL